MLTPTAFRRLCMRALVALALAAAAAPARAEHPARAVAEPSVQAAFQGESAAPGSGATLRFFAPAEGVVLQVFRAGEERARTRRADVMQGVPVTRRRWLGAEAAGSLEAVPIG